MDEEFLPARKMFLAAEYDTREGDVPVESLVQRMRDLAPITGALHALLRLLTLREGARVLDLGTGAGTFALAMGRVNPHVDVVGLDISGGAVAKARAAAAALDLPRVRFDVADVEAGAVPEADAALMAYALCLTDDPARVFRNVAASLRPGGRFVVFDSVLPGVDAGPLEPARLDALAAAAGLATAGRLDLSDDVRALVARGAWPWSNMPRAEARFVASAYVATHS